MKPWSAFEKNPGPSRRDFLKTGLLSAAATAALNSTALSQSSAPAAQPSPAAGHEFEWQEATLEQLAAALRSGRATAQKLTQAYLERIDALDKHGPAVNSVIELNPEALQSAKQ